MMIFQEIKITIRYSCRSLTRGGSEWMIFSAKVIMWASLLRIHGSSLSSWLVSQTRFGPAGMRRSRLQENVWFESFSILRSLCLDMRIHMRSSYWNNFKSHRLSWRRSSRSSTMRAWSWAEVLTHWSFSRPYQPKSVSATQLSPSISRTLCSAGSSWLSKTPRSTTTTSSGITARFASTSTSSSPWARRLQSHSTSLW